MSNRTLLLPGSECLYLRLYCSPNNCDYLLRALIAPFVVSQKQRNAITKFFFIRYADPENHLRIRFFGTPRRLLKEVLPLFTTTCKNSFLGKRFYKLEIGTYVREVERYGGMKALQAAETLFTIDSEAVLELLGILPNNEFLADRWKIALISVDRILGDFGLNNLAKLNLMIQHCASFNAEFQTGTEFYKGLSKRFRAEGPALTRLLIGDSDRTPVQTQALAICTGRSQRNKAAIEAYKSALANESKRDKLDEALGSIIHMHLNRLLRSAQRAQELVLCNFLVKLYRSLNVRQGTSR